MVPGTGSLIAVVLVAGFGFVAFLWFIFTLAGGENPLEIIRDLFHPPEYGTLSGRYPQNEPKKTKPEARTARQVYDEHSEQSEDPYSEEALEEAKCKKQLAINYYYYFAGKEKLIERAMKAKSENRGRRK